MAAGDAYQSGPTSVANNAYLDLAQSSGVEVVVHNAYYAGAVEFYWYDGTNQILFDNDSQAGTRGNRDWHCTNTKRVRIKNVSGSSILIAADGMTTK